MGTLLLYIADLGSSDDLLNTSVFKDKEHWTQEKRIKYHSVRFNLCEVRRGCLAIVS
ncbi:MAG: hypothetical protein DF168_02265 [Candidatus Moanabacter tarae]|uniref:Uncharacterized protein n=1 Tax=Candidatus Moanibacter tarae TaxID=2200854 RepID=A0A2Z4AF72_9BACT|nr:MAG: hypothetical protein DF168_02265 [Candidatus Moanabacter tarae]